jgi:hypothetical protein
MIEFILAAFFIATIGIKIKWWKINIDKPQYKLKPIFKSWYIYLPLFFLAIYIFCEASVFARWYWFIDYQKYIKTITLLSYIPLILHYRLYESVSNKLKSKNEFIQRKNIKVNIFKRIVLDIKYDIINIVNFVIKSKSIRSMFLSLITSPFIIGVFCILICNILNGIAIKANNGHMPIFPSLVISSGYMSKDLFENGMYTLGGFDTKLIPLTDWINIFGISVASIGDIFTRIYVYTSLYFGIKQSNIMQK